MVHGAGNTRLQGNTELPEIVSDVQDALAGVAKKVRRSPTSALLSRAERLVPIPRPCYYTVRVTDVRGGRGQLAVHEG